MDEKESHATISIGHTSEIGLGSAVGAHLVAGAKDASG
jgi:hypothetical protein